MKKRILSLLLALSIVGSMLQMCILQQKAQAATLSPQTIINQINNSYYEVLRRTGLADIYGWCGTFVGQQINILGITKEINAVNGNAQYGTYAGLTKTSGGYNVKAYPASQYTMLQALNAITNNGTKDVTNVLIGIRAGGGELGDMYGHAILIHAIIDGYVYASDSYDQTVAGVWYKRGTPIVASIRDYCSYHMGWATFNGFIHFSKDWDCSLDGHSWISTSMTAPSCTTQGYTSYQCTYCGATKQDDYTSVLNHNYGQWIVEENSTCYSQGVQYRTCTVCGYRETQYLGVADHSYLASQMEANCVLGACKKFTCKECGDTYYEYPDGSFSQWSEIYPEGVAEELIHTKTEYRYSDKETITSYEPSLPGYTELSNEWKVSSSDTVKYVSAWPDGFLRSNTYFSQYNHSAPVALETETQKTTVGAESVAGYIYWHWCAGYTGGPLNREIEFYYTNTFNTFHAFYSTTDPSTLTKDSWGCHIYSNADCCRDSYWYVPLTVYQKDYTTYNKLFTYERWLDWTQWSDAPAEESEIRKVESRRVYRYVTAPLGDHVWDEGIITTAPTVSSWGVKTYSCKFCKAQKTEDVTAITGTCGTDVTYSYDIDTGVVTIYGKGIIDSLGDVSATAYIMDPENTNYCVVDGIIFSADKTELISYPSARKGAYEIPRGVTTIHNRAFYGSRDLTAITIPETVTYMGGTIFGNCSKLEEIVIPNGITEINAGVFLNCTSLRSVSIPNTVKRIWHGAFSGCDSLTTLELPDSVMYIEAYALQEADALTEIRISESNPYFSVTSDGVLFSKDMKTLLFCPRNIQGTYYIPTTVEDVYSCAFYGCRSLSGVFVSENVDRIANCAFMNCTGLRSVTILEGLRAISGEAFRNCDMLTNITAPESVSYISTTAFADCDGLTRLVVQNADCDFYMEYSADAYGHIVLCGYKDSTTETFATRNGYPFFPLGSNCPHGATSETIVPATCVADGLSAVYCTSCGRTATSKIIAARGHQYVYATKDDETHVITCVNCDLYTEDSHSYTEGLCICGKDNVIEPVINSNLKMGHTLNLASDISVSFGVTKSTLAGFDMDTVYIIAEMDVYEGNTKTNVKTFKLLPTDKGSYYSFTLTGLTAINMNDRIRSVLYGTKDGQPYYSVTDDYGIADYAYAQMNKSDMPVSLKKLCADLLRYGAKAQIYKKYRTNALADVAMTEAQRAYLSDIDTLTFGNTNQVLNDLDNAPIVWMGKALNLESKVCLKFIFEAKNYAGDLSALTLHISYKDAKGGVKTLTIEDPELYNKERAFYAFTIDTLLAAELRTVVSAQIFAGKTPVSATLQYAADTYGNNKTGSLGELCKALFAYSDSAKSYFAGG